MKVFGGCGWIRSPISVCGISVGKNLTATMEAELPIAAMECLYRSPTLYWAMASALALCWGTGLLSPKTKTTNPNSRLTILRKRTSEFLRTMAEEALFAFMACVNMAMGVFFWILDFYHEGRPPPNANYFPVANLLAKVKEPDLKNPSPSSSEEEEGEKETRSDQSKPRRAGIIRPRKVKGDTCGCWGYEVQDIQTCASGDGSTAPSSFQQIETYGLTASFSSQQDVDETTMEPIRPRWSECQCPECAVLLMPLKMAQSKLFVRCDDMTSGKERCTNGSGEEFEVNTDISKNSLKPMFASPIAAPNPHHNTATRDSTAVVFLHGLFSSSSFWFDTKIIPSLSDNIKSRHRVLAPDLLGCGRSPRPVDCGYTLSDHIECLEKSIFQRHGLRSVHLVAHSMGCIMALVLAARCPERVRSITLIAPVYPPGDFDETGKLAQLPCDAFFAFINPFTVKGIRALLVSKYYNLSRAAAYFFYARHRFWVAYFHNKLKRYPVSFIADYITNHHDAAWHMTHNTLLGGTHAVIPALLKLQKQNQRIFVYHGEDDTSCQISLSEEMVRRFSNVELHTVPGFGHVDVLWKREEEPCRFIEAEILAGDAKFVDGSR